MSLESLSKKYLPAIEQELHRLVDRVVAPEFHELRYMLAYHLGWEGEKAGLDAQGKRIRPLLVLLCAGLSDPNPLMDSVDSNWKKALPAAASVELLHNFSLIHDDIQDRSPLRRGRPTVWVEWGIPQAINAGDTMFCLAQLAMFDLIKSTDPATVVQAGQLLNKTCLALTQGQFLDLSYENHSEILLDAYWPMVTGKTAALLAACTTLGALISGSNPEDQAAFHDFGHYLGLAFQVQDDLLGIWGESEQIGKSNTSDLASGKKSLPVIYGLNQNGPFYKRWTAGPISPEEAPEVALLLENEGAKFYTQQMVDQLTQKALSALAKVTKTNNENSAALCELANNLLNRRS